MKIISEAGNKDYLVKMSKEEIEIVLGLPKDTHPERNYKSTNEATILKAIDASMELNISKFFHKLQNFNKVARDNKSYSSARNQINTMLDLLTPVEDLISTMATKLREEKIE